MKNKKSEVEVVKFLTDEDCYRILDIIHAGLANMVGNVIEVGKHIVMIIDGRPDGKEWLAENLPVHALAMTTLLENIGRGIVDPRLGPACDMVRPNTLRKLPVSDQRRVLDGPLSLAKAGDDPKEYRMVLWSDQLSTAQRDQLLGPNGIRTVPEQLMYLESKQPKSRKTTPGYKIMKDGRICFNCSSTEQYWQPSDLLQLAAEALKQSSKTRRK